MKPGAFIGALVFGAFATLSAHHGQAGIFDESRIVELKGSVKQWRFINPHPILVLEAPDEKGVLTEWDVYFGPGATPSLRRQGFAADTFKAGETVIVKGHPARVGSPGVDVMGKGTGVTRMDGRSVP